MHGAVQHVAGWWFCISRFCTLFFSGVLNANEAALRLPCHCNIKGTDLCWHESFEMPFSVTCDQW